MQKGILIFFAAISVFLGTTSFALASSSQTKCQDIRKTDFNNSVIEANKLKFDFHDGKALEYEDEEGAQKTVEWSATFEKDIVIEVAQNLPVRFLLIHNNHEKGSGWRYFLVGYACLGGKLKQVFERDAISLEVHKIDSQELVISYHPNSTKKFQSYVWNDALSKFVLRSTWIDNK